MNLCALASENVTHVLAYSENVFFKNTQKVISLEHSTFPLDRLKIFSNSWVKMKIYDLAEVELDKRGSWE